MKKIKTTALPDNPGTADVTAPVSRRQFLTTTGAGIAIAGGLSACETTSSLSTPPSAATAPFNSVRDYVAAMEAAGNVMRFDGIDQDFGGGHADIGLDQSFFDLFDEFIVELFAAEHRAERRHKGLAGLAKPFFEFVDGFAEDRHGLALRH